MTPEQPGLTAREPLLTAITALLVATIALLIAFGVDISTEQATAIGAFVVALYGVAAYVRSKVTPDAKLAFWRRSEA